MVNTAFYFFTLVRTRDNEFAEIKICVIYWQEGYMRPS